MLIYLFRKLCGGIFELNKISKICSNGRTLLKKIKKNSPSQFLNVLNVSLVKLKHYIKFTM